MAISRFQSGAVWALWLALFTFSESFGSAWAVETLAANAGSRAVSSDSLAAFDLLDSFSMSNPKARVRLIAESPPVASAKRRALSGDVQMQTDKALQPFQLHGTYQHHVPDAKTLRSAGKQASHGIVGVDLMITPKRYPLVMSVFSDTPAERQGVQAGDVLMAVNGLQTLGKSRTQVDAMISDQPGERVDFLVQRGERILHILLEVEALDALPTDTKRIFALPGGAPSR